MNLVEVEIVEVIGEPKLITKGEFHHWELHTIVDCWGSKSPKIFAAFEKIKLEKYKVGYRWRE